jgi:uncharacterized protein YbaR (Trm112 family)
MGVLPSDPPQSRIFLMAPALEIQQVEKENQEVDKVVERLTGRFPDTSPIEIAAIVHEEHDKLAESKIRDFIPVLIEHEARDRLRRRGRVAKL